MSEPKKDHPVERPSPQLELLRLILEMNKRIVESLCFPPLIVIDRKEEGGNNGKSTL